MPYYQISDKRLINIQYRFLDSKQSVWPKNTNIYCRWCCHPFQDIPCAIPERYINNVFYVYGNFCSFNCAASFIFDKGDDKIWEKYSLLNLLYKNLSESEYTKIKLAPPRETLQIFGGHLSISKIQKQ